MPTDKKLNQLIINKLTAEQYAGIESPDPDQLYFVPDETDESLPPQAPEDKGKALLANGDGTASWKGVANAESANDWKEPQTFSGGAVADEIKSKSTGNSMLKTEKNTSGAWTLSVGSSARPTKVEGTEVDLAGALKAKDNGDVEVDGNATFSGKSSFIWHGTTTETIEGMTITSNVSGLFFQGPIVNMDGQTMGDPGILALTAIKSDNGIDIYLINPVHYDPATQEVRPATVEEILAGDWAFYLSVDAGTTLLRDRSDARLTTLRANKVMGSENDPVIDWIFKVEGENISLGEIAQAAKRVDLKSNAKYQHTITIKFDNTNNNILTFTAMCDNALSIASLQDLSIYFGGCRLACSGGDNTGDSYVYLDTHPSNPNDYVVGYINSTGFHTDETLGTLTGTGMTITDDVCIPK